MTDRERLAALIEQLPEDRLPLALARLEPLVKTSPPSPAASPSDEPEVTEFIVHDLPARKIRLPLRVHAPEPREQIVMEVGSRSEAYAAMARALSANARWWRDRRAQIVVAYSDTHIAISLGEVFEGASYFDALARAQAAHPADVPLVLYLVRPPPANNVHSHAN